MNYLGFQLKNAFFLAPMAGVSDLPFRRLCSRLGAGLAVSEMVSSNSLLYGSVKTRRRASHDKEHIACVQIAGSDPVQMAKAAQYNIDQGAQIIDINMGCPAKKICNVLAGSALLRDEMKVKNILEAVVKAIPDTPVTLKIRTGWDRQNKNALAVAQIAEKSGIQALAIHGRTRNDFYMGEAEYNTISEVKSQIGIPVIANGDITTPEKAQLVLNETKADGLMVGRGAQGKPWLFKQIQHFLLTGNHLPGPTPEELFEIASVHLQDIYSFYGQVTGVKIARKHIFHYVKSMPGAARFREKIGREDIADVQFSEFRDFVLSRETEEVIEH